MLNYIQLVEDTELGKESPFKAMAILNELAKEIKECQDQIKPIVIEEAAKYDKTFEKDGLKIEQRNGKRTFNYKHIKEVTDAEDVVSEIKYKYRAVWEAYIRGGTTIDESTGEVMDMPNVTQSADIVVIKNTGKSLLR